MELLYLLCSIFYTSTTSFFLSLLLPFRFLLHSLLPSRAAADSNVSFYEGTVWHHRLRPVRHSFRYSVRYTGKDRVTNTPWGERVTFVFDPESDLVAKSLQVSPFMDMLGNWKIRANEPGDDLSVSIESHHPHHGNYFSATLKAKRIPSTQVSDPAVFFWLMSHKVAIWIYWHALKLWWKNVPFIQHPRYSNPSYREESAERDQELRCGGLDGSDFNKASKFDGVEADGCSSSFGGCRFAWRDANWPWS